jgi:transcriptional regulator with XRE-family HTH domain
MSTTSAAALLRRARRLSRLSQQELARLAGVSQSVLSAYERGRRQPSVAAADRIVRAAGFRIALQPGVDEARSSDILPQLLDLTDALPTRPRGELVYPRLP